MGAARMLSQWTGTLQAVFPGWHGHQIKGMAMMSLGMCLARHCQFNRIAAAIPTASKPASVERRCERLVSNPRLNACEGMRCVAAYLLRDWSGRRVQLAIDETPMRGDRLRCLKVSVLYYGRALPLVWVCYRPGQLPDTQPHLVEQLLTMTASCLPADGEVVLMADRGLSWPLLIDLCRGWGWHFVLRVPGSARVRLGDGRTLAIADLLADATSWTGAAEVFKKAGWRPVNVVAVRSPTDGDPWLLVTDRPPTRHRCVQYRRRMRHEQAFRDEKGHGFEWQRSHVTDPAHAERLLLALALAMWLAIALGSQMIKRGRRREVQRSAHRLLSVFQIGLRWLNHALTRNTRPPPCSLKLYPYDPKTKSVGA